MELDGTEQAASHRAPGLGEAFQGLTAKAASVEGRAGPRAGLHKAGGQGAH